MEHLMRTVYRWIKNSKVKHLWVSSFDQQPPLLVYFVLTF